MFLQRIINGDRHPCVCDLTHCVDALTSAVESAKAAFDVEAARPPEVITPATVDTSRLARVVGEYLSSLDFLGVDSVERGSKLNKLVLFLNEPLHELLPPVVRLDAFAPLRQLVQHLGGAGLLELGFAIGSGDFRPSSAEIHLQPFPAVSSILAHIREDKLIADVILRLQCEVSRSLLMFVSNADFVLLQAREKYRARDLNGSLFAYGQLALIDPLDWQSRLNSAAIRLCLANDSDQKFQSVPSLLLHSRGDLTFVAGGRERFTIVRWRFITDRPTSRRSIAVLWRSPISGGGRRLSLVSSSSYSRIPAADFDFSVADFERALKIEPKNPVAKQQLTLARMRRS